jgi:hypothetical protein
MKPKRNPYRVLFRKSEVNNHLEELNTNENNIKMYLKGISWGNDLIHLAQATVGLRNNKLLDTTRFLGFLD